MRCTYQPDKRALFTSTAKIAVSAKKVPETAHICKAKTAIAEPIDNASNSGFLIISVPDKPRSVKKGNTRPARIRIRIIIVATTS